MLHKRKQHLPVLLVFGVIFLLQIALFFAQSTSLSVDSYEYITADGFAWLRGVPNRYRLPLYPALIDICTAIFGAYGRAMLCAGQLLVHMLSVVALYDTMRRLAPRRGVNLTVTAFYALAPSIMGWQRTLLTESLSLSLTVFVLWALVCYLKDSRARYLIFAVIALTLGCLLRAVFALYAGIVFGFILLRLLFPGKGKPSEKRARRVHEAKLLPITAIPVVLLLIYAAMFNAQYGAFTLSDSGTGQQLAVVLQRGYYEDSQDEELRELSREFMNADRLSKKYEAELDVYYAKLYNNGWTAAGFFSSNKIYPPRCYIMEHYDHDRINAFVSECKQANRADYAYFLSRTTDARFYSISELRTDGAFPTMMTRVYQNVLLPQSFSLLHAILVGVAELGIFLYLLLRRKQLSWLHLGLAGFILATGILAIIGTNADFARTAQTLLPFVYAAVGLWIHMGIDCAAKANSKPCVTAV